VIYDMNNIAPQMAPAPLPDGGIGFPGTPYIGFPGTPYITLDFLGGIQEEAGVIFTIEFMFSLPISTGRRTITSCGLRRPHSKSYTGHPDMKWFFSAAFQTTSVFCLRPRCFRSGPISAAPSAQNIPPPLIMSLQPGGQSRPASLPEEKA